MSIERSKICHQLKVLKRIQETSDTISLVLDVPRTPGAKFNYKAGQFITFFMDINETEVRRSYSLASSPEVDGNFKVTIKLVPGGLGSTYLINHVNVGDILWTTPPAGFFCLPADIQNLNFAFFAAGSGITPIISLLKSALVNENTVSCSLFYQNRTEDNVIFKAELDQLKEKYDSRLNVSFAFTQPSAQWQGPQGRINRNIIQAFLSAFQVGLDTHFYMCGPDGFMATVDTALRELNYPGKNIIKESFAIGISHNPTTTSATNTQSTVPAASTQSAEDFALDQNAILIGDQSLKSKPNTIEAIIEGETHTVEYKKDESILDCLLGADLNPPYSCLDGACMACIAKVNTGLVFQKDMGILTDDNVEASECLTCQARPASKYVKVIFESF